MSAQPAYAAYPERAPQRSPRPRIRVVPGQGTRPQPSTQPSAVVTLAKVAVIVAILLTCVAFVRVGLTAATVSTAMESQNLSSQIDDARATGASLEVSQSLLSNPSRVRQEAERLGMAAPTEVGTIVMPVDVVQTDDDGALSLSKSVAAAATAGE